MMSLLISHIKVMQPTGLKEKERKKDKKHAGSKKHLFQ